MTDRSKDFSVKMKIKEVKKIKLRKGTRKHLPTTEKLKQRSAGQSAALLSMMHQVLESCVPYHSQPHTLKECDTLLRHRRYTNLFSSQFFVLFFINTNHTPTARYYTYRIRCLNRISKTHQSKRIMAYHFYSIPPNYTCS